LQKRNRKCTAEEGREKKPSRNRSCKRRNQAIKRAKGTNPEKTKKKAREQPERGSEKRKGNQPKVKHDKNSAGKTSSTEKKNPRPPGWKKRVTQKKPNGNQGTSKRKKKELGSLITQRGNVPRGNLKNSVRQPEMQASSGENQRRGHRGATRPASQRLRAGAAESKLNASPKGMPKEGWAGGSVRGYSPAVRNRLITAKRATGKRTPVGGCP